MASVDFVGLTLALTGAVALAFVATNARVRALEERLGLSVIASSGMPFLLLGALLAWGPVGLMNEGVLADLRPAFEFGLGWIGFLIGMRLDVRRLDEMPASFSGVVATTSVLPMAFTAIVCLPVLLWLGAAPNDGLIRNVAILSACAAASAPVLGAAASASRRMLKEVTGFDELVAICVLGAVTLLYRPDQALTLWSLPPSVWLLLMLGLGALLGILGYALIRAAHTEAEEFAKLVGVVALASGVAGYMALSVPVLCAIAGATLINLPMRDREGLLETLDSITRPLYLVFLVVVGATWNGLAWQGWVLAFAYAVARMAGTWLGCAWASRLDPVSLPVPRDLVAALAPQSPFAVVVIVAATTGWVGERAVASQWTVTAVVIGAVLLDIMVRPLRQRGTSSPDSPAVAV